MLVIRSGSTVTYKSKPVHKYESSGIQSPSSDNAVKELLPIEGEGVESRIKVQVQNSLTWKAFN